MEETKQDVICIIGMHRSGTSMVAHLLNLFGLDLGPEEALLGPSPGNPLGHFEHTGFLAINEALLRHFGGSWDKPPDLKPGWEQDSSLEKIVHEAQSLVKMFSTCQCWGWKEPRTTILLPFWKSLIPNIRFLICVRSPLEVARSLGERDGISMGAGVYLWNRYTRAAIQDTAGHPRIFTFYQDYFDEAVDECSRVVAFCALKKPGDISRIRNAISEELRIQTSGAAELLDESSIPAEIKLFYLGLRALSFEKFTETNSDNQGWKRVSENAGRFLRLLDDFRDQEKMVQLQSTIIEKEQQFSGLQSRMHEELTEKNEQIAQLQEQSARLQAFADTVRQTFVYRFYRMFIRPFTG